MTQHEHSVFVSKRESDTEALGKKIAAELSPGSLVTLDGDLGAGKTTLAVAIIEALRIPRVRVQSPTFVLSRHYEEGNFPIYHWDFYRIGSREELLIADFHEILAARTAVVLIEWASRFREEWDFFTPRWEIVITEGDGHDTRHLEIVSCR